VISRSAGPTVPLAAALALAVACSPAPEPPTDGLQTPWTAEALAADVPLPDYPRPQIRRDRWTNLNGMWELAVTDSGAPQPDHYTDRIRVPFAIESALSGVAHAVSPAQRAWYRRVFPSPERAAGERVLLHFGAVDWETRAWLNGHAVGTHRGGYDAFTFDITDALRPGEAQELVVSVWDPTDEGDQPRGKQVLEPGSIWYTGVTGIWQTVWLEPVPATYVDALRIVPDVEGERFLVTTAVAGDAGGPVTVAVHGVGRATGPAGEPVVVPIPDPHLWSPDDPYLYDLTITLPSGDAVDSYAGMRSVAVAPGPDGHPRLVLNGEPVFHFGLLDQGWWPDGLYTAPTDEALAHDIEVTRRLGFNTIRKHVKVEPERWYWHADRLGVLVWQDMPSADNETEESRDGFTRELEALVAGRFNHPSIVMWVPFNEGWGQHDTGARVDRVRALDPTRLVNNASGWTDAGVGDVRDVHRYPGPGMPEPEPDRAAVLGEFGGLGLPLAGHTWMDEGNWGYRGYETRSDLVAAYRGLLSRLRPLIGEGLAGAIYTQTTDVEIEVNGIMTYDRRVVKLPDDIALDHAALYGPAPIVRTVVPTSRRHAQTWQYRTMAPEAGWQTGRDGDSGWATGPGGFGTENTPGARVGTTWDTPELWARRPFTLDRPPESLWLRVHHDEDATVWVNGTEVASLDGYTQGYVLVPLGDEARDAFRAGANTLAVYVRQTRGGQFMDVGIVEVLDP
jgi:hypothetical protein